MHVNIEIENSLTFKKKIQKNVWNSVKKSIDFEKVYKKWIVAMATE